MFSRLKKETLLFGSVCFYCDLRVALFAGTIGLKLWRMSSFFKTDFFLEQRQV